MMIEPILDVLLETLIDTLKMIPILYLAYLLMEFLEQKAGEKLNTAVAKVGLAGPALGSLLGIVPQCGFSSAIAGFFSAGIVTTGTLFAVFLATSDEMLPMLIANSFDAKTIIKILIFKLVAGLVCGFMIDIILKIINKQRDLKSENIHEFCERENCECHENIFLSALKHTVKVIILIFVVSIILATLLNITSVHDFIVSFDKGIPVIGEMATSLIGLIPNCSSSVIITQLFIDGIITPSQMMAGLLTNAGVGLLVLFRLNKNIKQNILITVILYVLGVLLGLMCGLVW